MDAKALDIASLAALSVLCAMFAWAGITAALVLRNSRPATRKV